MLLVSVTVNVFFLGQLAKVPVFFEHFYEHKQLDAGISLLGFLIHHYSFEEHTDDDSDRDMQLPFKSLLNLSSGFDFHAAIKSIPVPNAMEFCRQSSVSTHYLLYIPTPHQQSQFKPPRS